MTPDVSIISALVPEGYLRAAINLGNPILARRDDNGDPVGISIDLARVFAKRLNVPLELVALESAEQAVQTVSDEKADVGFFAVDPLRAANIEFTKPYLHIEGAYLVRADSSIHKLEHVDQPGIKITVGKGSAYDLFLSRELKHAEIMRAATSPAVVETFLRENTDVAAGVRQQLLLDADRHPGLRVLPGNFMTIRQAIGISRSRGQQAAFFLTAFVEEIKRSGFIENALVKHEVKGASVPAG